MNETAWLSHFRPHIAPNLLREIEIIARETECTPVEVIALMLGEHLTECSITSTELTPTVAAAVIGRLGARLGGIARAAALTPERRQEIGRRAAETRWAKRRLSDSP